MWSAYTVCLVGCCLFCLNDKSYRQCKTIVLNEESGVQLTRCLAQTKATSGCTMERPPPPEGTVDKEGRAGEAVSTLVPQQGEVVSGAADATVVDPRVEEVVDEGAKAEPHQEELPSDDPLPEGSRGGADVGVQGEEDPGP